jgi:hypothetical protein
MFGKFLVFWPEFCPFFAKQKIMSETQKTPMLAQNAPFARLGAPTGCQSVALLVHMAETRHSRCMFGQNGPKTAEKRPDSNPRDPNRTLCLKIKT